MGETQSNACIWDKTVVFYRIDGLAADANPLSQPGHGEASVLANIFEKRAGLHRHHRRLRFCSLPNSTTVSIILYIRTVYMTRQASNRRQLCYSCILCITLCLAVLPCFAQGGRAELFGVVQDAAKLPISGANVRVEEQATKALFTTISDDHGRYHFLGLPAGRYVLSMERPGFRIYGQSGIVLRIADQVALDIQLEIGQPSQWIEVTAQASLLQTASGSVGFNVDQKKVATLPLDGRNFIPLIALSPGVALPGGGSLLPRINGSRPRTNEYTYDGISALQPEPGQVVFYPIIDAIEEFRVNTNSYAPEYGRSNGGAVIVNTKPGGNDYHGTLFEFFRNEDLNARNYFTAAGSKPEFRRNQYGFTLGGPIQRNRTFFFVDWQGTRLRTGVPRISTVPTQAQRAGVFSTPLYDPSTPARLPFPGNEIPSTRIDPIAAQILARYPEPNRIGTANNYIRTGVEPDNQDQFDARLDRYFGVAQRLFGRFSYLRDDDTPVTPLPDGSGTITSGVIGQTATRGYQGVAEHAWALSPTVLNQARFGYTRRESNGVGPSNGGLAAPGIPANSFSSALPTFLVGGYQQIGPPAGANSRFTTSVTEYIDTMSLVRGKHRIEFGADVRREALDVLQPPNPAGAYTFNTTGTNKPGVANSGNPVASLLLGQVGAFAIDIQRRELQERANIAEFFVDDDWKVSKRLTLNLGTRYTLNFPSHEVNNQGAVFNLGTQVLDSRTPHAIWNVVILGLERFGLSSGQQHCYPVGVWNDLVRADRHYDAFHSPTVSVCSDGGKAIAGQCKRRLRSGAWTGVQVISPNPNSGLGQGVFGSQRNNGSGYSQQWNFTVQRTFRQNLNVEIGYLGSKNTRLGLPEANLNQLPAAELLWEQLCSRVFQTLTTGNFLLRLR